MNPVFFTFFYPPLMAPRSIQIARMVKYSRHPIRVICAQADKLSDTTLEGAWGHNPKRIDRIPWAKHGWYLPWNALLHPPVPDHYRHWAMTTAQSAIERGFFRDHDFLVTFGQPMSDHLAGLKIKKSTGLPWLAHFSDPWSDSPYRGRWPLVSSLNRHEERAVVAAADCVVFTSDETLDLVMAKYPGTWRTKARVLPHAFDPSLYRDACERKDRFLIRHLGALRKPRTADALLRGLQHLAITRPDIAARIQVELVGRVESDMNLERVRTELPDGVFKVTRSVDYLTSLTMMSESDLLLVLDAPFDSSVFLPSKLIDYIGAGRPILAVTPQGTSGELVAQLGGWTVDPLDPAAIARKLVEAVEASTNLDRAATWGTPSVRNRYEATSVVAAFDDMIEEFARTIT
ncbi:MAG: hypothetical protein Q8O33_02790 [Pseudomonadota bacterium]|nr:hypothetical protein [Pseudomonadota bacterium]